MAGRKLRDFQQECMESLRQAVDEGSMKNIIVSPTGSGKGALIGCAPAALRLKRSEQLLVVVHMKDLVNQLAAALREWSPTLNVDVERAQFRADPNADVIVASIQTLGKSSGVEADGEYDYCERLKKSIDPTRIRHVIVDECHRAARPGGDYHRLFRYLNVSKRDFLCDDPSKTLTCFTATVKRSDNIGMEEIVDKLVFSRDILTLMTSGLTINGQLRPWLSPNRSYRCDTEVDLNSVAIRSGDFAVNELQATVNTPARNQLIVDKYREWGEKKTFFAFTTEVQHTNDLAATFQKNGYKAYPYSGTTPDGERRRLMAALRAREIDGLVSCDALNVGVDVPSLGCLLFGRPMKSSLLFQQQFGRGCRSYPAPEEFAGWKGFVKNEFITIDFVDVCAKHSVQTVPSLFGLRPDFDMKGKRAIDTVEEVEELVRKAPGVNLELYNTVDKLKGAVTEINLFAKPIIPEEIRQNSQLAWTTGMSAGTYQMTFDKSLLTIRQNTLGGFDLFKHVNGVRTPLGTAGDLQRALALAEMEVPSEWYVRLQADANWRFVEASDAQLGYYAKLYPEVRKVYGDDAAFAQAIRARYNKGELSMLITQRAKPPRSKPEWARR